MSEQTPVATPEAGGSEEIAFARRGALAEIELTRPKALNSLSLDMIRRMDPKLAVWAADDEVRAVVIRGQGEKAFCAGGDVRAVYDAGPRDTDLRRRFFAEEYTLNRRIHACAKPYVALIDGITMGGGVGVSVHGSHRVAGDRTMVAMPETAIGFFPDVGATWVLSRLPGQLGMYLALTGARLKAADAVYTGLATHYVPSERMAELEEALPSAAFEADAHAAVDDVLTDFAGDPGPAPLAEHRTAIDRCFAAESVEGILAALDAEGTEWAQQTAATLRQRSPSSMKVTFAAIRAAAAKDFDACMVTEYRLSQAMTARPDFFEGVRAVLVDKDNAPAWNPARLEDVTDAEVARCFEPLDVPDLTFSG